MEEVRIRLNNFLYNSGILGFYRILENMGKTDYVQEEGNSIIVQKAAFEHFEDDYIQTMLDVFEEDTKWHTIVKSKEIIKQLDSDNKKIENYYSTIKKAIESASYKSGYEIIKKNAEENPYELLKLAKEEKNETKQIEYLIKIVKHLEKNKETYCMKDIIYTKINCFWDSVAFLNRASNKNDIKEEYRKVFVTPVQEYIKQTRKSEYQCIECGSKISKKEASGMSWLKDVGVDMNRKKSGFWNFKEDTFLCPICNLIYSCIPLGFHMIGSSGIFVNNNESITALKRDNIIYDKNEKVTLENTYHKIIHNYINYTDQMANEKKIAYEPKNIQIVKRGGNKDNQYYEFNILSKDKLEILRKAATNFEKLVDTTIYQETLNNLLQGIKQYYLIDKMLRQKIELKYVRNVLNIQAANMEGGKKLKEREEWIEEMIEAGQWLQIYFFKNDENKNKLESYALKLQNALKANSVENFMKLFTLFYGSLGQPMPKGKGMRKLIEDPEYFRLLGYAYVYGIGKVIDKKGEYKNEE